MLVQLDSYSYPMYVLLGTRTVIPQWLCREGNYDAISYERGGYSYQGIDPNHSLSPEPVAEIFKLIKIQNNSILSGVGSARVTGMQAGLVPTLRTILNII